MAHSAPTAYTASRAESVPKENPTKLINVDFLVGKLIQLNGD